ncbi:hypothetical protein DUI87_18009 [Hirundo rustica rustica]|uniref:Uncharacterized protein n=1 Tax=Hirundo rustica rustica TaxID=333673 RepID=A0A3M0JVR8_HIRRU|nr:hypothetical protein DUI87_18009 [Hirundo rustica rustica]
MCVHPCKKTVETLLLKDMSLLTCADIAVVSWSAGIPSIYQTSCPTSFALVTLTLAKDHWELQQKWLPKGEKPLLCSWAGAKPCFGHKAGLQHPLQPVPETFCKGVFTAPPRRRGERRGEERRGEERRERGEERRGEERRGEERRGEERRGEERRGEERRGEERRGEERRGEERRGEERRGEERNLSHSVSEVLLYAIISV